MLHFVIGWFISCKVVGQFGSFFIPFPATPNSGQTPDRSTTNDTISLPTVIDQNMDTATPTKQNVTDRELDPTKPQSTGNVLLCQCYILLSVGLFLAKLLIL
jgi:hypothetical protein